MSEPAGRESTRGGIEGRQKRLFYNRQSISFKIQLKYYEIRTTFHFRQPRVVWLGEKSGEKTKNDRQQKNYTFFKGVCMTFRLFLRKVEKVDFCKSDGDRSDVK